MFRDLLNTIPAQRVVVIDECSTHRGMTPRYARAPRGQRAFAKQRRNYGRHVSLIAGLRLDGMTAPLVVEGAVDTACFVTYVRQVLLPVLRPGDIVILDNLSAHKSKVVRGLLLSKRCRLLFLPAYSPDLSPIEQAFAKLKQFLRRAKASTLAALINAIAQALQSISPLDALGFFLNCGFVNVDLLAQSL